MTEPPITFSAVIPLYNKGPHIARAIDSALAQTLPVHEVIVVDDGSSDDGLEIVRSYDDARIRILTRSPPGPGGYAARNLGVEAATGGWIAFLDADDLWLERHLADLAHAIASAGRPVRGAFSGSMIRQAGDDRPYRIANDLLNANAANDFATILRAWLATRRCPLWTGAVAFERSLLIEAGLFPAGRARRGGDKDLWLRAIARTPVAYSPGLSAEFHQDTVNRVTTSTSHATLPILCETIATLLPMAEPITQRLLKRLSNQEIALYARFAVKTNTEVGRQFFSRLYLPQGLRAAAEIAMYRLAQPALKLIGPVRTSVK